jgi:catechol 2,3-dioxygenase-like lactoylglutathione lyase family enzyme
MSGEPIAVLGISAVTLATHDMGRAVRFYRALGLELHHGGETASFTSFALGRGYLNLIAAEPGHAWGWWGRVILYVGDVASTVAPWPTGSGLKRRPGTPPGASGSFTSRTPTGTN